MLLSEQLLRQMLQADLDYMRNRIKEIEEQRPPSNGDFTAGWNLGRQSAYELAARCIERALTASTIDPAREE
ncbi:MAG: hypothetical protein DCC55_39175 [Chloroflexi bacterium]|nr:MAG: hypothetical protein DCC55_39175 [Chloroflexota bacterium]